MAIDNFKTEDRTFDELLNRYGIVYKIPVFQRDYSWTLTQWDDLWSDIVDTLNVKAKDNPNHYMGYLVLKKRQYLRIFHYRWSATHHHHRDHCSCNIG